ncbi:LacI family transcriptional regulator [Aliiruegeria haliotis]|uniref:LacI family transcriptional regulator n=1 Tax=Aliiruegeria haliotis TaxID=1280846 RepID=A0A2T0RRX7_9RHOB|nr:LacI family DNA-binding transcriptional regulator [Aliiruegeria haliotis]PRY23843.1 LacI family transcriptional regulator [Aliiruegeria haliotis]
MAQPAAGKTAGGPRRPRVTISDVAQELGLTKGTVSRALNGYADISESTRNRVLHAAEAMGYRPLSHAQAIRTGKVRSVGLVLQLNQHDGHRPFLQDFLSGISEAASAADWTMTMATASSDEDTQRLLAKLVAEHKADGFILPRTYMVDARAEFLRAEGVPFVLFGRTRKEEGCAWFDVESEAAMEEAVRILHGLGHRRIGFVPGSREYTFSVIRQEGYEAGLRRCGLPFDSDLVGRDALSRASGAEATRALLSLPEPPTAIVFCVDRAAIGAYEPAHLAGLAIGHDLSVISYDGIPEGGLVSPKLSTFSVDMKHAGERLAQLLIRRIEGEAPETLRETVRARFLARGSHGQPALSSADVARRVKSALNY